MVGRAATESALQMRLVNFWRILGSWALPQLTRSWGGQAKRQKETAPTRAEPVVAVTVPGGPRHDFRTYQSEDRSRPRNLTVLDASERSYPAQVELCLQDANEKPRRAEGGAFRTILWKARLGTVPL